MTGRFRWLLALVILCLVHGWVLQRWVKADTRPLAWDQSIHTRVAMDYKERMTSWWWVSPKGWLKLLEPAYFNYPPLYHYLLVGPLSWVDDVADAGAMVNFFFLCLLVFSIYFIGEHLMGVWEGGVSAVLVSCYPMVMSMARETMIDLSLTASVALCVWMLLKSDGFSKIFWSVGFGTALGLSMLIKWTALAYVLGPLAAVMIADFRRANWRSLALSIGATAFIAAPWYMVNLIPMMSRFKVLTTLPPAGGLILEGWKSWLWYPVVLPGQMNLPFFLLLAPGLVVVLWRPRLLPIFLWFVVSLFLFTCINNRNTRYSLPALPAAALLSVAGLPNLFKRTAHFLVLGVALVYFSCFHFFPGRLGAVSVGGFRVPIVENLPPLMVDWQHRAIIKRIDELLAASPEKSGFRRVVTVSNAAEFHSSTLNISLRSSGPRRWAFRGPSKQRWLEFAGFVLTKTGDLGPGFTIEGAIKNGADFLAKPPRWFIQSYKEAGRWPLPDGSEAVLYQFRPEAMAVPDSGLFNIELEEMTFPRIIAKGVKIKAVPLSAAHTRLGRLKELNFQCRRFTYKNFEFENISLRLINPQINLPYFLEKNEFLFSSLERMEPKGELDIRSLLEYASGKLRWLKSPAVHFEGDRITVEGRASGIPLLVMARVSITGAHLATQLEKVRVMGLPVPILAIKAMTNRRISLAANSEMPFDLAITSLKGEGTRVQLQ